MRIFESLKSYGKNPNGRNLHKSDMQYKQYKFKSKQ